MSKSTLFTIKTDKETIISSRKILDQSNFIKKIIKYENPTIISLPYINGKHFKFIIKVLENGPPPTFPFSLTEAFDVLALSDYLITPIIHQYIGLYISNFIQIKNVFSFLRLSRTYNSMILSQRSTYYIGMNLPILFQNLKLIELTLPEIKAVAKYANTSTKIDKMILIMAIAYWATSQDRDKYIKTIFSQNKNLAGSIKNCPEEDFLISTWRKQNIRTTFRNYLWAVINPHSGYGYLFRNNRH